MKGGEKYMAFRNSEMGRFRLDSVPPTGTDTTKKDTVGSVAVVTPTQTRRPDTGGLQPSKERKPDGKAWEREVPGV